MSIVYLPEEKEDVQYVKKKVEEAGKKCHLMQANSRDRKECERVVEEHVKVFGKLNVLVNNGKSSLKDLTSSRQVVKQMTHADLIS